LRRNSGTVIFDLLASSKMALKFEKNRLKEPIQLNIEKPPLNNKNYVLKIAGKGDMKGRVIVQQGGKTIRHGFIKFENADYQTKKIMNVKLKSNFKIILKLSRIERNFYLDFIEFVPL
jgi:hypothetical protein